MKRWGEVYSVSMTSRVLDVSRSGYCDWLVVFAKNFR
jgi:hypothetical protein